jgi:hypothetical protein
MEVLYPHCAGLDVHKERVVACVRHMVNGTVRREVRTFKTTTKKLLALSEWLAAEGCTHIAMEGPQINAPSMLAPGNMTILFVRMGARASGLGQAANGGGEILGPLSLALIAGTNNVVAPQATMDAVLPAFMLLAACGLATGLAFTLLAPETHGRPIPQGGDGKPQGPFAAAPICGHHRGPQLVVMRSL